MRAWKLRDRSRRPIGFTFAAAFSALSLFGGTALAQDRTFTLDRAQVQVSGAPDDGFMVQRAYMGEETRFYGNAALGFALNPLKDSHIQPGLGVDGGAPMTAQLPVYLTGGLQLAGIVGLNFHIPFTPLQIPGAEPVAANTSGLTDRYAAMNDLRFDARVQIWESNDRRTRIGAYGAFTIATGAPVGFGGDRSSTALIGASGEHTFGKLLIAANLAPHFRPSRSIGSPDGLYVGSELRYALGAYCPLRDNRIRLGVEFWGSTGIEKQNGESTFDGRHTTVEWLAQGRFTLNKDKSTYLNAGAGTRLSNGYGSADLRAMISIGHFFTLKDKKPDSPPPRMQIVDRAELHDVDSDGDGYPDSIDACPQIKEDGLEPDKSDGCPKPKDSDSDGYIDVEDKCPNDAEDFDGLADDDGCPEDDFDKDTVKDNVDKCPKEPGPPNADASKNGCPTLTKVTGDGMVSLLKPIEFDRGKSTIKERSYPILKEVATLMKSREGMKLAIHGHTDNVGGAEYNKKLSQERAASVRKYMIGLGIDSSRLESEGFGQDKPIDTNDTVAGRGHNRRVEFVIKEDKEAEEAWE